jgi:Zn-dependent M16 (insulinase) family peptidase
MNHQYGFELIEEREIAEVNSVARYYRHVKTGAELLSLINNDENKVFGITFRTPPSDSTGVAHIMEHAVLCGSRKYPVKEPFVELMKGSLNTFLNAMTFPDKTCYPVASQNLQDFYNLIDVYLDAVFYPLIPPHTLLQEGWHYELETADGPLNYKGVVYNEMKGAYSSPDNVLDEKSQQLIFPDTTYGIDSGGDPSEIPNLTYDQFKQFHDLYYHPSNARIFFYGDDDPVERLRLLDEYLRHFERIPVTSQIELQQPFDRPREFTIPYEVSSDEEKPKSKLTVNWLLGELRDPEQWLSLQILEHVLIGTPGSPLRKALIESGLGEDLAGSGLADHLRQMYFSTGMNGIARESAGEVEQLIYSTLEEIARDGVDAGTIAASVNTIEFHLRENNTGSYPRGLLVMLRSLNNWLYEKDPFELLAFEAPLNSLKSRLDAGESVFERLIEDCLLRNHHRTTIVLVPDPTLGEQRAAAERERLDVERAQMHERDLEAVLENTKNLRLLQETPDRLEALASIPSLTLADLDKEVKTIPLKEELIGGRKVLYHDLFTNGILYMDLGFDLHKLPQEMLPYIRLFGRALLQTGTKTEDYVQLLQRIGRTTGGISPTVFTSQISGGNEETAWLFLRSKVMVDQVSELSGILRDVFTSARFDNRERLRQMVLEERAGLESALASAGHRIVNARLRAKYNLADWISEQIGGISYLFFLRELVERIDQDWPAVLGVFESIRSKLIGGENVLCNITTDGEAWSAVRPQIEQFLQGLPEVGAEPANWQLPAQPAFEGLTIPAQVNFVGKAADLYELGYQFDGSSLVVTQHLSNTFLWDKVRVQGGAYGGFASFDRHSGVISLLSYRDPNLLRTLEVYDQAADFLQRLELDEAELTKAIIGVIGNLDSYMLPDAKGYTSMVRYLTGTTEEERQRIRDEVLSTRVEDFRRFGQVLGEIENQNTVAVLGSAEAIQTANQERTGWLDVKRVL